MMFERQDDVSPKEACENQGEEENATKWASDASLIWYDTGSSSCSQQNNWLIDGSIGLEQKFELRGYWNE